MKRQILVIDPHHEDNHENLKELFELNGSEVFIAKNEDEATTLLEKQKISKVLIEPLMGIHTLKGKKLDISGPRYLGGVGFELYNRIKKLAPKETEFILHTVVCKKELNKIGFPTDMRYFQKPFCFEKLSEEILN